MIIPFGFLKKKDIGLPVGTELYSWSDAASPTSEANSINLSVIDGWSAHQNVTLVVSSSEFTDGLYSIEIEALAGASDIGRLHFTTEIGATYRFTYSAKVSTGGIGRIRGGGGWVTNPGQVIFTDSWVERTFDVTAKSTTGAFNFYATFPGGASGQKTWVDKITMIKL